MSSRTYVFRKSKNKAYFLRGLHYVSQKSFFLNLTSGPGFDTTDVRARAIAREHRQLQRDQEEYHKLHQNDPMSEDTELQEMLKIGRQDAPSGFFHFDKQYFTTNNLNRK